MKTQRKIKAFTLIEALVALLIVGIALPTIISQVNNQVRLMSSKRDQGVAYWVAENQLARLSLNYRLNQQFFRGREEGATEMNERTWYWSLEVEETPAAGVYRQTVRVRLDEGDESKVLVTLVAFAAEFNEIAPLEDEDDDES